jgi:hypothetical protein
VVDHELVNQQAVISSKKKKSFIDETVTHTQYFLVKVWKRGGAIRDGEVGCPPCAPFIVINAMSLKSR